MTGALELKVDENCFLLDFEKIKLTFYTLCHKNEFGKHSWYHYGQYAGVNPIALRMTKTP